MSDPYREMFDGLREVAEALVQTSAALVQANEGLQRAGTAIIVIAEAALHARNEQEDVRESIRRLETLIMKNAEHIRQLSKERGTAPDDDSHV